MDDSKDPGGEVALQLVADFAPSWIKDTKPSWDWKRHEFQQISTRYLTEKILDRDTARSVVELSKAMRGTMMINFECDGKGFRVWIEAPDEFGGLHLTPSSNENGDAWIPLSVINDSISNISQHLSRSAKAAAFVAEQVDKIRGKSKHDTKKAVANCSLNTHPLVHIYFAMALDVAVGIALAVLPKTNERYISVTISSCYLHGQWSSETKRAR